MNVPGPKVVITGASSGIGRALALEYAGRGATLGLIARRADQLAQLAASLPVRSYTYAVDVTDADALATAAGAPFTVFTPFAKKWRAAEKRGPESDPADLATPELPGVRI